VLAAAVAVIAAVMLVPGAISVPAVVAAVTVLFGVVDGCVSGRTRCTVLVTPAQRRARKMETGVIARGVRVVVTSAVRALGVLRTVVRRVVVGRGGAGVPGRTRSVVLRVEAQGDRLLVGMLGASSEHERRCHQGDTCHANGRARLAAEPS
jgi:hypothetical protein